ncbi:TPM domain-containing protein [Candidatus Bipolaricaulota bacterium]|nr:TPM domain-containing protein [Candidatus Bipolaricaulota bacterium]
MRELQPHPIHRLIARIGLVILLVVSISAETTALQAEFPQSIGAVSDYGNVLNHGGRLDLAQRATSARAALGIDVYLLATWESPTPRVEDLAAGILSAWGIAGDPSLLVVFLRDEHGDWTVAVQVGAGLQASFPDLRRGVLAATEDLVANGRVQEAMAAVFEYLESDHAATLREPAGFSSSSGRALRVATLCLALAAAAWVAWRRVCPRCGRFLRKEMVRSPLHRVGPGLGARSSTVYFCRRCGYQRFGERARRSRRGRRSL